jgi:tRNA/tmRNA/rRNA uracil-C5-methylase (TrmA/RlmC/RlmD family)
VTHTIRLTVGAPAHGGHCIARHEGRAVFVRGGLPGEVVEARVEDPAPDARFWNAQVTAVLEASNDRVEHPWPEAGVGGVGGAELGHVSLPAQRDWKLSVVRESLSRFAGIGYEGDVRAAPGDDERGGLRYRTRVSAMAGADGKATMAVPGTGERVTLQSMPLAVEEAEAALLSVTTEPGQVIDVATTSFGETYVSFGKSDPKILTETVSVDGRSFAYALRAGEFWQVHREAPRVLLAEVMRLVGDAPRVLDLYSGAGLFAVPFAAEGRDVTAVELAGAYGKGKSSLQQNLRGYATATAIAGDTRRTVSQLATDDQDWSRGAVVLDPPRSGAKAATIKAIASLAPERIVYVACDPVALGRDAKTLTDAGYVAQSIQSFDLFPMTHHIETIASFVRAT